MELRKLAATVIALTVVALVYQSANGLAQNQPNPIQAAQQWEYKTQELPIGGELAEQESLNKLGEKRWELVTITFHQTVPGMAGSVYYATLKRPKER